MGSKGHLDPEGQSAVMGAAMSKSTTREKRVEDQQWKPTSHGVNLGHSLPGQPGEHRQSSFHSSEKKKEADIPLTREGEQKSS